jgi:Ca2+-binding EF-hand superfamily protein
LTFKSIDVSDEGFIDIEKLDVFLRRVGYSSSESELIGIIRRMDKNGDMTITFKEWQDYFQSLNEAAKSIVSI